MTKKEMITKMQLLEAAAWLALRKATSTRGEDDWFTNRLRSEWCAVSRVMDEVGVAKDQRLPDNQEGLAISLRELAAKREAEAVAE